MSDLCRAPIEGARRRKILSAQQEQNWLLSGALPAARPFVQTFDFYALPRRRRIQDDSTDWIMTEMPPPLVGWESTSPRRPRGARADDIPNLLLTTLAGQAIAPPPFIQTLEYSYSLPRRAHRSIETERDWLLAVAPTIPAVPPVAPDMPYTRAVRAQRFDQWPNLQLTTLSIVPQSASYQPFDLPPARRVRTQRFDDYPNLQLTTFGLVPPPPLARFELTAPARRARRTEEAPNLLLGTFSIVPQAVLPFASGEWPVPKIRRPYAIEASLNLTLTTLALVTPVPPTITVTGGRVRTRVIHKVERIALIFRRDRRH